MEGSVANASAELAALVIGPAKASLTAFDNAVEDHLQRIDEISAVVDSLRLEIQHTSDTAFPILLQNCQELEALYAVIDAVEGAVERTAAAAGVAEARLGELQAGFSQRHPEVLGRIASSLFGKARGVVDAPVRLPPYNASAARVDVAGEMASLRGLVGTVSAVDSSSMEAFTAGVGNGDGGGEGAEGADGADGGSGGGGYGGGGGGEGGEGADGGAGKGEGADAGAGAGGGPGASSTPARRIAAGEDDEDEEEDDE